MTAYRLRYGALRLSVGTRPLTVGRGADCDLRLDDPQVSRCHAEFVVAAGVLQVRDRGSRNGVLVDGRRIRGSEPVRSGCLVQVGRHTLEVVGGGGDVPSDELAPATELEPRSGSHGTGGVLSARERQVLVLVAGGLTQQQVADRLHVSVKTIETHVRNAKHKLGATSRADLVEYVRVAGLRDDGGGPHVKEHLDED